MMEAYCVKCKTKREMIEPKAEYTATGTPGTRGKCPVCGTTLYKMGATPEHAQLPKPEVVAAPRRTAKKSRANGKQAAHGGRRIGKLVIVESPTKAKTVGRFLGKGYTVEASVGHVRDLLRSTLSVDVDHDFTPKYRVPNEKKEVVKKLADLAGRAESIYLATDPDREGEAIAWHLMEAAGIDEGRAQRVVFHEITPAAIDEAFAHPREIDMKLVDAQQARRILDRLVGYELSPLLWRKIRGRLSAGRVQSVALRLIVEREREIQAFVPVEYWTIAAELARREKTHGKRPTFTARLIKIDGKEVDLKTEADTRAVVAALETAAYQVANVKTGERRRKPSAPFTTSTLQQEANRKLGYPARRTMGLAQALYEGKPLGEEGSIGLITYMRTDSTNVAESAQQEAREFIRNRFGAEFLPDEPPQYKTRAKNAQEAHEAIRPTSVNRTPESIKAFLDPAEYKVYDLIWKRFVASQMNPAVFDTVSVDIAAGEAKAIAELVPLNGTAVYPYLFRATGSTPKFAGYLAVYEEAREEDVKQEGDDDVKIPPLTPQEVLDLIRLLPEQHFTEPPPRYTEASLVKALEEYGIGRPSTYASILGVIDRRGYVEKREKRLHPTEIGFTVNDMLVEFFADVVDVNFTAWMENELDEIAEGAKDWVPVIREFYEPFQRDIEHADASIEKVNLVEELGEPCPLCGKPLIIRYGRYGKFIGCSDFPNCRYTAPFLVKIGVKCPQCGTGDIVEKKTQRGRVFYGCSNYKNGDPGSCDFTSWNRPIPQPCPNCGGLLTMKGRDGAKCIKCENEYSLAELPEAQLIAE